MSGVLVEDEVSIAARKEVARLDVLGKAQIVLERLETDFFHELSVNHCILSNEYDGRAAAILPTVLNYYVRVEEKKFSLEYALSGDILFRVVAQKAAELLPKVRESWQKSDFTFDYCATRRILWGALIDGLFACGGLEGQHFLPVVARALLACVRLSKDERKARMEVFHEKFERAWDLQLHYSLRFLFGEYRAYDDKEVLQIALKGLTRHADWMRVEDLVKVLALTPKSMRKKEE